MQSNRILLRKVFTDITKRKGRTSLIIFIILIGVLGLTAVNVTNEVLGGAFIYAHDQGTNPDMRYSVHSTVNASVQTTLRTLPNVAQVQLRSELLTYWHTTNGTGSATLQINGYADLQHIQLGTFRLTQGRMPGPGEIVMDSHANSVQPIKIGDTITITTFTGTASLHVVGIASTRGWSTPGVSSTAQAIAYMQDTVLQQISGINQVTPRTKGRSLPNLSEVIMVKVRDTHQMTQTYQAVMNALTQAQFQKIDSSGPFDTSSGILAINGLLLVLRVLSLTALLLTGMLIINTMTVLVTEQTRIIGTMKAMGGRRQVIMQGYLLTVEVYSLVGTILGLAAGIFVGNQLAILFAGFVQIDLNTLQLSPLLLGESILVGLLLPPLAALLPLWQGTRITVREAIAAYGVSAGSGNQRAWGQNLAWIPQTVWLGVRGLFRKRMRATLTTLALALSCAVFLAVQITTSSIAYTQDQEAHAYDCDLFAQVAGIYHAAQILQQIQALANVERVEPRTTSTVTTSKGPLELNGLDAQTLFYQHHLVAGRWLVAGDVNSIVLSDLAAQKLHLQSGNMLTLTLDTKHVTWQVVGIVHDLTTPGTDALGEAFTTLTNLNVNLLGLPANALTMVMVRAHNRAADAVDQLSGDVNNNLTSQGYQPQVSTRQELLDQAQNLDIIIYVLFYTVAIIVALVGLLGLFCTLSTSVLERQMEIGIMRSLGAKGEQVASVFWLESTLLTFFAWCIGILLGIPAADEIISLLGAKLEPFDFVVPPVLILTTLGFALVVSLLASVGPVLRASRLPLREVLRYE